MKLIMENRKKTIRRFFEVKRLKIADNLSLFFIIANYHLKITFAILEIFLKKRKFQDENLKNLNYETINNLENKNPKIQIIKTEQKLDKNRGHAFENLKVHTMTNLINREVSCKHKMTNDQVDKSCGQLQWCQILVHCYFSVA